MPDKAYLSEDFMRSRDARPIRILSEYINPERILREANINHTIVFFGSARIRPDGNPKIDKYYKAAEELAYMVGSWSKEITDPDNKIYVCTGGGPGIMEAANRGASRAGEKTIGLNISLPFEQVPNPYISPDLNLEFHYFYMRKLWFLYYAKAIVVFPGGFGTMDELFETLTLFQTKKIAKPVIPILLYDRAFWKSLINLDVMVEYGLISEEDTKLYSFFESPQEGIDILKSRVSEIVAKYESHLF